MQKEYRWILIEHDESAILIFDRLHLFRDTESQTGYIHFSFSGPSGKQETGRNGRRKDPVQTSSWPGEEDFFLRWLFL